MKQILLLSLALATFLTLSTDASSFSTDTDQGAVAAVPLIVNPHYKRNTPAHIQKLNKRYPDIKIQAGGGDNGIVSSGITGRVAIANVNSDLEYYGTVKVGTPAQLLRLNFDTGSSDIWFPSTACSTPACKSKHHTRFNPSSSSTYKKDGRPWKVEYGDGSVVSGQLASEIINVGGVQVRQTVGLATNVSSQFKNSPEDGIFGLGFSALMSVKGINTFMDNAIKGTLKQPLVSVFLPSSRRNGGQGGHVLFGGIDHSRFNDKLHYVPVTQKGYWQVKLDAFKVPVPSSSNSTGNDARKPIEISLQNQDAIIDTGTTLIVLSTTAAKKIHSSIPGSTLHPELGWLVPCTLRNRRHPSSSSSSSSSSINNKEAIAFKLNGKCFHVPLADLAFEAVEGLGEKGEWCLSGVQGGQEGLWILGDVFIKNHYAVFEYSPENPRVGLSPLKN
ncbi:hypothetical protein BGZ95_001861 [Linnemannia exigua]|uniref:rhizopuspepsin n=1 Tax=Linnemannia exigua TaxID=604196 RepID=A0AAD4D8F5_9FUNG|nr:hypothetical protein BGZ95_001861 [Linnemannia exigua]